MTHVNYPGSAPDPAAGPGLPASGGSLPAPPPLPVPSEYVPLRSATGAPLESAAPAAPTPQNPRFPDGSYGAQFRAAPMTRSQRWGCAWVLAVLGFGVLLVVFVIVGNIVYRL